MPSATQSLSSDDLRRDNSFRVAGAAAVDILVVFTRFNERRHGVHVRREHDARRRAGSGKHIEAIRGNFLHLDAITQALQVRFAETSPTAFSSPVTEGMSISLRVSSINVHGFFVTQTVSAFGKLELAISLANPSITFSRDPQTNSLRYKLR